MPNLHLPLSGDVTQAINPWTWIVRAMTSQVGFINVNMGKSADPELEQRILDDVGTYGRQLGRIGEALEVLLRHVRLEDLNDEERDAVEAFRLQQREIARVKARHGASGKG